ncbi:PilN domain-containing protein [Thiothrix nivea]|uniref:Fimbrial assembly family protein n=1 Tax=Thiothrix nivea (strain ATCC 35100 / DSM 5205 / JP2) TaxID=870187 RepID=A0A656HG17_THINJ|nr:PilN domain-containing protein [Thiothrix nivea]EIJ33975.1 Fimbrial assembly family protein [Thiothrix nivea DSM 5205]
MAGLNLLPWREKAREQKKKQFFTLVGMSVALAAAGVLVAHQLMLLTMEHQQDRNQLLTSEIAQLDKQIKEIEQLDTTRQSLLDRMQVIEDLQSTRPAIVHLFDEMVNALPKGMYLLHLKQEGTKVQLEGKAESYARVSSYMNRLDASPWLSSSNLNIISAASDSKKEDDDIQLREFKLDVTQLLRQTQDEPQNGEQPQGKTNTTVGEKTNGKQGGSS